MIKNNTTQYSSWGISVISVQRTQYQQQPIHLQNNKTEKPSVCLSTFSLYIYISTISSKQNDINFYYFIVANCSHAYWLSVISWVARILVTCWSSINIINILLCSWLVTGNKAAWITWPGRQIGFAPATPTSGLKEYITVASQSPYTTRH